VRRGPRHDPRVVEHAVVVPGTVRRGHRLASAPTDLPRHVPRMHASCRDDCGTTDGRSRRRLRHFAVNAATIRTDCPSCITASDRKPGARCLSMTTPRVRQDVDAIATRTRSSGRRDVVEPGACAVRHYCYARRTVAAPTVRAALLAALAVANCGPEAKLSPGRSMSFRWI
jgi:hypothetical protein